MKRIYILFTGLLLTVAVTAFAVTAPNGGKDKKKPKTEVRKECVNMQSQTGCTGHAAMKPTCDQAKCQGTCDPAKCQGTCDPAKCKEVCSGTCANGTCDPAKCPKHAETVKK